MLTDVWYKSLYMYAVGDRQLVYLLCMVHTEVHWMMLTSIMHSRIHWLLELEHVSLLLFIEQPRFWWLDWNNCYRMHNINVKMLHVKAIIVSKMTSHCAGTVQMREESERGIRKWEEMWFKMRAEDGERGGSSDVRRKTVPQMNGCNRKCFVADIMCNMASM